MSKDRKVNVSVNDFPLLVPLDYHFGQLKKAGADGIELVPGYKSRFNLKGVQVMANQNGLAIDSLHQPFWSIAGAFFDEGLFKDAADLGINTFVFHPPSGVSFEDDRMKFFLEKLAGLQHETGSRALVENMPWEVRPKLLRKLLPFHSDVSDLAKLGKEVSSYGLGLTLDISHVFKPAPQTEEWFEGIYPLIENIHLSSFIQGKDHLPVRMGDFRTDDFMQDLEKRKYSGLITLEINYPRMVRLRDYDYDAIATSVQAVKCEPSGI